MIKKLMPWLLGIAAVALAFTFGYLLAPNNDDQQDACQQAINLAERRMDLLSEYALMGRTDQETIERQIEMATELRNLQPQYDQARAECLDT